MTPKEEIIIKSEDHAKKTGIRLNPDSKRVDEVVKGLLLKKQKYGETYCPCRIVSGNKEKDKDLICPCTFHRQEIELKGHCLCYLFVK